MISMPGKSFTGPLPALTDEQIALRDQLRAHVQVLAVDIGERNILHFVELQKSAAYIERTLKQFGYATVDSQTYNVDGKDVRNLSVEIGGRVSPEQIVIVGAHYDAVHDCPAANDNGSGVAATLELARRFAGFEPNRTLRFVFFVNEEPPYFQTEQMGSLVYARACKARNENIVAMFSLETIGYFDDTPGSQKYPAPLGMFYPDRGNFIAFVGNFTSRQFVRESVASFRAKAQFPSEGGTLPESLPGVGWSDHWSFSQVGYPALMITDTAPFRYPHYHTPQDTIDKIDFDRMTRVVSGVELVIKDFVNRR
ncbi:MAG: M28 family peptidase [Anaerolineae bacterium]|nr:M28 family peptidase [Phycisphaerae bacterium]